MTKPSLRQMLMVFAAVGTLCVLPAITQVNADEPDFAPTAKLGDAAPALKIQQWIKGGPVTLDKKNIYVVEVWATHCPRCIAGMPKMSQIQTKYKDKGVVLVGVSSEDPATVQSFVQEMGDQINYAIAVDENEAIGHDYMLPYGFNSIPMSFVIDKSGNVVWRGRSPEKLDEMLGQLVEGKYDMAAEARKDQILAEANADVDAVQAAMDAGDGAKAHALLDAMVAKYTEIPMLQMRMAWVLMKNPDDKIRDAKLALRAAKTAYEFTKGEDFGALDTYANALHANGDLAGAIQNIQKAIELAPNEEFKSRFQKTLEEFKMAQNSPAGTQPAAPATN